ncbi:MAG: hypothetical protein M0Z71_00210 [Nitrospiraceae bacterium]|nr:hypothetical protein [Nitrospiraceae bacterium]
MASALFILTIIYLPATTVSPKTERDKGEAILTEGRTEILIGFVSVICALRLLGEKSFYSRTML